MARKTEVIVTCNAQQTVLLIKTLEQELQRVTSAYKKLVQAGQGNSDQAKDYQRQIKDLNSALKQNQDATSRVSAVMKNLSGSTVRQLQGALREVKKQMLGKSEDSQGMAKLRTQYRLLNEQIEKTKNGTANVAKVMGNLKGASLDQLKKAASQLEKEMAKLNRTTKSYADKKEQLSKIRQEIAKSTSAVTAHGNSWKNTFQAIAGYMGVTMIIGKVQQMLSSIINLNLKFSDQLADIRKVSGLAMTDINNLATRLAGIDTRTTIQELNQIAYAGAKLGIGKYGVEGLQAFTNAANQVNVALKEDLGEDALTALSKITEVMGLIPAMGVEKSMLATGSAMFKLSATSTATAGNIVEFAKRLTGMARSAGITTDQLLALGSAADSMYLMPEVASTAFNKFISALQTNHNLIENNLAIEPGTISKLYEAGQIVDAMVLVFEQMKKKGNMNALKPIFKDLGSDGARLVNVMVTMSQNIDMLKDHLYISAEAFKEATAVTDEYNIQQETAQALMERASNLWQKAFVNPEGVDTVHSMAQAWYDVSKSLTESTAYVGSMRVAFELLIALVKVLITMLPAFLTFLALKGAYAACMGVVAAYGVLKTQIMGATAAQQSFNAATKANVWMAIASAIVYAVVALKDWISATDEAATSQRNVNDYLADAETAYRKQRDIFDSYVKVLSDANTTTEDRTRLLRKFNTEFRPYINKLNLEINSVDALKASYKQLNDEIRKKAYYQLKGQAMEDMLADPNKTLSSSIVSLGQFLGMDPKASGYDVEWIRTQLSKGLTPENVAKAIASGAAGSVSVNANGLPVIDVSKVPSSIQTGPQGVDGTSLNLTQLTGLIRDFAKAQKEVDGIRNMIDNAFDSIIGDYDPFGEPQLGNLENEAPDKAAIREAKKAENERKKALRESLREAQDEGKAVVDNVKNFYERQLTQLTRIANEQGWDAALLESATQAIIARENLALSEVRKGIVGVKNNWEEFKLTMRDDMIEIADETGYNLSDELLNDIVGNNLDALHNKIASLNDSLGLPSGASFSAILKNATLNEKANETAAMRHNREQTKIRLEDDYTGKVNNQYELSMTRLGYFDVTAEQAEILAKGGDEAAELLRKRGEEITAILTNARSNFAELLAIADPTSQEGLLDLERILYGENPDYDELTLKPFLWESEADIQLFYDQLVKYNNDYIEATKQAADRAKKIYDFMWSSSEEKRRVDEAERENSLYQRGMLQHTDPDAYAQREEYGVYGNLAIMPSFGVDPEVEAYRLRMEAAKAYYDFILAHGATEEQLAEQRKLLVDQQNEYVAALASNIKEQMDDMLALTQPIQDFGLKAGDALATLAQNAEDGKKAMKAAVADMINSLLKQSVQLAQDYIKRRIMQRVHDRLTQIEAQKHEADMTLTQQQGEQARELLHTTMQEGISDIDKQVSAERLITKQSENVESVASDAQAVSAQVPLGIAGGAAKTIQSLGWWGIPLVAVITALLNALLGAAMSKVSSAFGGGSKKTASVQNKLVSGMLTYDIGNVQSFRGVIDGKTYPVVGDDGEVYAAKDGGELSTGLVKDAITTFVNGQPALVAERGPEMVIGRETTAAMMMARPDLLAEIVKFDKLRSGRTYRAFDEGNVSDIMVAGGISQQDNHELRAAIAQLSSVLTILQQKGIQATINKYGRGGIVEEARSGSKFMERNSSGRMWR